MEKNTFIRLLFFAGFFIGNIFSTWFTIQSITLTFPQFNPIAIGISAMIFFTLASIGLKMILTALDGSIWVAGRGYKLIGGSLLMLFFWVFTILRHNTHALFYNNKGAEIVMDELRTTRDKLGNILAKDKQKIDSLNNVARQRQIANEAKKNLLAIRVRELSDNFNSAMQNRLGNSWDSACVYLARIETDLGISMSCPKTTYDLKQYYYSRPATCIENIDTIIARQLRNRLQELENDTAKYHSAASEIPDTSQTVKCISELDMEQAYIEKNGLLKDNRGHERTNNVLVKSIREINKRTGNQVPKGNPYDKTETRQITNVGAVWSNALFGDNYKGKEFGRSVLIALLLDISGFVFFNFAFKKN